MTRQRLRLLGSGITTTSTARMSTPLWRVVCTREEPVCLRRFTSARIPELGSLQEGLGSAVRCLSGLDFHTISEQSITAVGSVAYGHNIQTGHFTRKDGSGLDVVARVTDVYRKIGGRWLITQEHVSFPVELDTGKADLLSKP